MDVLLLDCGFPEAPRPVYKRGRCGRDYLLPVACVVETLTFSTRSSALLLRKSRPCDRTPPPIMGGAIEVDAPHDLLPDPDGSGTPAPESARGGVLPSAAALDRVAYRVIAFAFPIWTFAVIAGAIWAESAWGRFWGWDPKETWAFISWALYAAYLHARSTAGWRGRPAAWINLVALASLVFNLLFVNLVSTGLHSYGGVS